VCSSDNPGCSRLSQGHFPLDEVDAAKRMKEKQDAEERTQNETAQEMKGKEKADERTLNETPTNATKNATAQKRRRQVAKTSTHPRIKGGSGLGASQTRTSLPSVYGRILR
jgi:hypothetical protein